MDRGGVDRARRDVVQSNKRAGRGSDDAMGRAEAKPRETESAAKRRRARRPARALRRRMMSKRAAWVLEWGNRSAQQSVIGGYDALE